MKLFDSSLEALIIKYTLGTSFIVIILVFGLKIVILLSSVAKIKIAATLAAIEAGKMGWLIKLLKLAAGGVPVK